MSANSDEPPAEGKYVPGGDLLHSGEGAPPQMGIEINDLDGEPISSRADEPEAGWLQRAREAYEFSTSYVDSNYRKKWEDGIRAFNNQHPTDSKYNAPSYSKRSNLYRPKTRAAIRKNEAAASQAFFANPDAITCEANNQADKAQQASAEVMKQLIQYRLEKTMPWYITCIGGLQDAQTTGAVAAHIYWDYCERDGKVERDTPCVDLIPVENLRIDPGADWRDPVQSSPYVIQMIPMYIGDVRAKMRNPDPKTGAPEWKSYGLGMIRQAMGKTSDSTRITRNKDRQDPYESSNQPVSDYEVVWVHRHIHRYDGRDWTFYTLADVAMLTDAVPLDEVVHHGQRPYVLGCCILETHKIMASGVPELSAGLQREANELGNTFLDNVYFVLNKAYIAKRGQNTDLPALVRNSPGRVILTNDPEKDIKEINWPDVTPSSAAAQDRMNADFADLTGDFSANQAQLSRKGNEPGKIMSIMAQSGNPLTEYLLRTYVVTFIEPVLRQVVLLEQEYETDQTVIAIAGQKAQLQKFGLDRVTDDMLRGQMTIRVNVGMGATDPYQQLQKFLLGVTQFKEISLQAPPGLALNEVAKEIFGKLGYQDGARFFNDQNPEIAQLKAQLQHAGQVIQELGKRHEDKERDFQSKEKIASESNLTSIVTSAMTKDPHLARVILQKVGPGQGLIIPPDLPPVDTGKPAANDADPKAIEREAKDKEAERNVKLTIAGMGTKKELELEEKRMKFEREKLDRAEKQAKEEREFSAKHDLAKEEHKQGVPAKIEAAKTDPLKKVVEELAKVVKESLEATKELATAIAANKVKEAKFTKDKNGNFTMQMTEHATKQ